MKRYKQKFKEEDQPLLQINDQILYGKFRNKLATITGFSTEPKNNQPTVLTDKGELPMYHFRIRKLMV